MLVTHSLTHSLTHSCLVNLIDVTLACEDANSKLVEVVTIADVDSENMLTIVWCSLIQGCIFRLTCSHPELTEDHVLTSAYVKIFRIDTRNAVNIGCLKEKKIVLDLP